MRKAGILVALLIVEGLIYKYLVLDLGLSLADEPVKTIFAVAAGLFIVYIDFILAVKLLFISKNP
jgi:hypothetical protein